MLIVLEKGTTEEQIQAVVNAIEKRGYEAQSLYPDQFADVMKKMTAIHSIVETSL